MIPSQEQIELAIMKFRDFNFRQNLMVFRVTDFSGVVNHECDCLILNKSGYLSEIEIKRSYSDFLADFKKTHCHDDEKIQHFHFMVHKSFAEKVFEKLIEMKMVPDTIYSYDDDCNIKVSYNRNDLLDRLSPKGRWYLDENIKCYGHGSCAKKLFLEERYQLARLGSMRYKNMTEKLINSSKEKNK